MHFIRGLTVIACSVIFMLTLRLSVMAQIAPPPANPARPVADEPEFTWMVTVTVEPGSALATALPSRWSNAIISFPVGVGGLSFSLALPSDATDITATASSGDAAIIGTTVYFTLTQDARDCFWAYTTGQSVLRLGNQFRIDQRTSATDAFYRQISTIYYPAPYLYVGTVTNTPQIVTTDTLHWDLVVPLNDPPFRHLFQTSSWFADPRLGRPDLSFTGAAMSIESGLNPPIAHLTATVRNNNPIDITSTNAILEFYDRASPSAPPDGPLDHDGGWCGTASVLACPALPTFANPIPSLGPGDSTTVAMTYPLTRPGLRDYYFQIDTFGGAIGLNYESDESNNVYTLTQGVTIDYLASVSITGPVTGTVHTPYQFEAQVMPALAVSRPLTYTWSPAPLSGQGTANATYAWVTGTPQTIAVTARNANQIVVTDTHTISIEVPLTGALISGPITVSLDVPHAYQVYAQPVTATQPLVYVWDPEPTAGQGTAVATYILTSLGEQTLNAYVSNLTGSPVSAMHNVVSVPPLTAVTIGGPGTGRTFASVIFTATIQPVDAATPLNYLWSPAPANGQGTPYVAYQWSVPGTYPISVAVSNDSGPVVGLQTITIKSELLYLPLVRKS